ncbi:hypothetical protein ACLOJK_011942 [Asimina triloba]
MSVRPSRSEPDYSNLKDVIVTFMVLCSGVFGLEKILSSSISSSPRNDFHSNSYGFNVFRPKPSVELAKFPTTRYAAQNLLAPVLILPSNQQ